MKMTVRNIIDAIGGTAVSGDPSDFSRIITHIITDTRVLPSDEDIGSAAFLALKGESFDGDVFAPAAAALGVGLVICGHYEGSLTDSAIPGGAVIVTCGDTLKAYGRIAAAHRLSYGGTVIGITGSVGKTTTKEYVYRAVGAVGTASKTKANFNNEVGVPKTILDVDSEDAAVVEMGMRGRGQIEYLAEIVRPDIAIITNVGYAHIELLKTLGNTLRAKLEIASQMRGKGTLIMNGDDGLLSDRENVLGILDREYGARPSAVYYGTGVNAAVRAENIDAGEDSTSFDLVIEGRFVDRVTLSMRGRHNVYGALAGIAAAFVMTGDIPEIADKVLPRVAALKGEDFGRQKIVDAGGVTVIDDCYNAGPESVKAQLTILAAKQPAKGRKRVAVLGDMLELGGEAVRLHREVAAEAIRLGIDRLVCVGSLSANMDAGCLEAFPDESGGLRSGASAARCEFFYFDNSAACAEKINSLTEPGDVVLVKGSHGMHMEKITAAMTAPPGLTPKP